MGADKRTGERVPDFLPPEVLQRLLKRVQYSLLTDMVMRKLGKQGVRVGARHKKVLRRWLEQGAEGDVPLPQRATGQPAISLEFTRRDQRRLLSRVCGEMTDLVSEVTQTAAERIAGPALKHTERELTEAANLDERLVREFEHRLGRKWKRPIELLRMQLHLARTLGAAINDELRRNATKHTQPLVDVLTSLHARACQIAGEVLVLLRAGYADGAIARWRSLHEASVVMQFIDKAGAATAKRYLDHEAIESWRGALEYGQHCERLGFEAINEEELLRAKSNYDAVAQIYGQQFKSAYGWAGEALQLKKDRVSFEDVEKGLGLQHWRPFYRLASHPVHANPKSVKRKLGTMDDSRPCLLTGPSNYGLADPGQSTGLSLAQATAVLITRAPTQERLVAMFVMKELAGKIARAFVAVQRRMERQAAPLRPAREDVVPK